MSWFIRELPLRETVTTGDLGDTYATPRDTASLVELVNMIGRLDRREGARDIIDPRRRPRRRGSRAPRRAGCWRGSARSEHPDIPDLAAGFQIDLDTLTDARRGARNATS